MNTAVLIPTFIQASSKRNSSEAVVESYDYVNSISNMGNLERCLASLENVQGLGLVIILASADPSIEYAAISRIRKTVSEHPSLNAMVIGSPELEAVRARLLELGLPQAEDAIGLRGYGAIRNLGLVLTDAMGFDAAIFLDENEIIDDEVFMEKALYGLGRLTRSGVPILAKTGYYLNSQGSYLSSWENRWYNHFWRQGQAFNDWITQALAGPRLSRSNHVCGGCMAIHKEAFRRLAFDPWIPRGEATDYMIGLRMYGSDIWFDNKWSLSKDAPASRNEGLRFRQEIYRWLYESAKLQYSYSLIDLQKVTVESLMPYPGSLLRPGLKRRIAITAFLRSLARPDKKTYRANVKVARKDAVGYAEANCTNFFAFQQVWPQIMEKMDRDEKLTHAIVESSLFGRT